MKYLSMAAVMAALLAQTAGAYAISFSPPRSVSLAPVAGEATAQPIGLSIGLAASSWGQPDRQVSGGLGTMEFDSQVRPLITAEYRLNDKFSVGGWYNFVSWDVAYKPAAAWVGTLSGSGEADGGIFEVHGTYDFAGERPVALSAQLGYQRLDLSQSIWVQQTGTPTVTVNARSHSDRAVAWGLGTYKLPLKTTTSMGAGILGGLGLAQGLNKEGGPLEVQAMLGLSLAFTPAISADASAWLTSLTRDQGGKARYTVGVTGRF